MRSAIFNSSLPWQDDRVVARPCETPLSAYRLSPGLSPSAFIGSGFISSPTPCPDAAAVMCLIEPGGAREALISCPWSTDWLLRLWPARWPCTRCDRAGMCCCVHIEIHSLKVKKKKKWIVFVVYCLLLIKARPLHHCSCS